VAFWSASEAKDCTFLLISVLNLGVSDEVVVADRETKKDKKREKEKGNHA